MRSCGSKSLIVLLRSAFVVALTAPSARAVTIDWVTVGDPGNSAIATYAGAGPGAVSYSFRIGKYEVTIGQYTDFLNAVAATDTYSLYNTGMVTNVNSRGISRAGVSGSYTYSVINNGGSSANRPITFVSWFDAARFANWMHNGQGSGSTETGAYTLLGGQTSGTAPAKNPGAKFYIPTEDEWFKAGYYKGSGTNAGYWTYATQSDTAPGNAIGNRANQANFWVSGYGYAVTQSNTFSSSQNYLTDVGAFTNSASAYGTFDQNGNVSEWTDFTGAAGSNRKLRGGEWLDNYSALAWNAFDQVAPSGEYNTVGFRLASPLSSPSGVPEIDPAGLGSVAALVAGALALRERCRFGR
jgi:sulfatase modifying factor 1